MMNQEGRGIGQKLIVNYSSWHERHLSKALSFSVLLTLISLVNYLHALCWGQLLLIAHEKFSRLFFGQQESHHLQVHTTEER
jgi:hypothetical protein